ncbi:MAG: cobalt ECF transporter T component CbiQ [Proteobacteria bacterium]|nr:cobalt ECF transporter T component CbiQ [Pseudomonadota bacterium]MBU4258666.1 cobalt ECF transporter T component CbiQ [Pseudomonadota bacterium]MBU4288512.1 cobalt ECF transporter T component CbiQ [Pseudomonadota bacterium]MCG2758483.1 cobalt ECF transporter T component CbiQ [Desulfobacteraceae bacterium]
MNRYELTNINSLIKRLDPRVKILEVFFFSIVVAVSNSLPVLFSALAISCCIVLAARIPAREIFRRLVPVNMMIIFLWFFLPFTIEGKHLFNIGPLAVTHEGLIYAFRISIKSNAMMLMLISLIASTAIFTLGHAMLELKMPKKLVHLFFFTYRYIHVMNKEYIRLINAIKIRGFRPGTNLHTYRTFAYIVGMLLIKSFDRMQRVRNAMLCRGFKGNFYTIRNFSLKKIDAISIVFMFAVLIILGILEWTAII